MRNVQIEARRFVQVVFLSIVIFIGVKFYLFVSYLEKGVIPSFERPAGVEAFLPISAIVSLKHWLFTGSINSIHPSALVLFLIICFTALFVKKGFCSWVCPIGLLSDILSKLNEKIFKKKVPPARGVDLFLRTLKYGILAFFTYQIFWKMPIGSIEQFIQSPYNRFADIKMLKFFTQISATALTVIIVLTVLSIVIQNFWCRYLCPYGALLGLIGVLSLGKVTRSPAHCTGCGKCEKACPGRITIRQKSSVLSPECSACMTCVGVCPEEKALGFSFPVPKKPVSPKTVALFLILVFSGGITIAKLTGNWQNRITKQEYLSYAAPMKNRLNALDRIDPQKMQKMILMMRQLREQQIQIGSPQIMKGK
ncbi:MAG TPA: FeS-binding protein [Desulfobacteraceae bacterium]|nr:FeS-binding protein [Desulfobacteraceae bacterium]